MSDALILDELRPDDVARLAEVHVAAFPGFFLSTLGEPFIAAFYRGFLDDRTAVTVVARRIDGSVVGAAVGTTEPAGFFRRLLRRRWPDFVAAGARAVARRPSLAPRLAGAVLYRGDPPAKAGWALLSSICVAPAAQGDGIGQHLLAAWTEAARSHGVWQAYLTTDAQDNDAVNRFYQGQGWVLSETYSAHQGRRMNRYTRTVAA